MRTDRTSLVLVLGLVLAACGGDDGSAADSGDTTGNATGNATTDANTDGMTGQTTAPADGSGTSMGADGTTGPIDPSQCNGAGGAGAVDSACTANSDCASGVCTLFSDAPVNADAVCAEQPPVDGDACNSRITATVYDFSTRTALEGASVKVAGALDAITNPTGATAIVSDTSDADGRIDVTTEMPISTAIAIIALVEGPGGFLTATGLASPDDSGAYPTANGIHDLWLVPQASLDAWSDALGMDAGVPPAGLPLGSMGGVVGLVRDASGMPIAGAVVQSGADTSNAVIRYVGADNSITSDMTTETGIFVVVGATPTGEDFVATMGGTEIGGGRAGTTNGAVFTLIINAG